MKDIAKIIFCIYLRKHFKGVINIASGRGDIFKRYSYLYFETL